MKKFWEFLNSPIFDIISGFIMQVLSFLALCFLRFFSDFSFTYGCIFSLGLAFAISLDCLYHGFERLRLCKNSSIGDDNDSSGN